MQTVSRRYHRRRSDSPPKSPSQSDFPYNLGDPNDAVGAETSSVVKQEPSGDDVPNSMTALRRTRAASAPPPSASGTASTPSSSSSSSSVASTTLSSSAAHSTTPTPSTTPAFDNTLASLKFTVESIDLGTYEQEKVCHYFIGFIYTPFYISLLDNFCGHVEGWKEKAIAFDQRLNK